MSTKTSSLTCHQLSDNCVTILVEADVEYEGSLIGQYKTQVRSFLSFWYECIKNKKARYEPNGNSLFPKNM